MSRREHRRGVGVRIGVALIAVSLAVADGTAAAESFSPVAVAFQPKSNALVLARGHEGGLRLVDFTDPAKPVERALPVKAAAASFLPDGRIVTGAADGMLRFWSPEGAKIGAAIRASANPIASLAVSARTLAAADERLVIQILEFDGRGVGRPLRMQRQRVEFPCAASAVAIAPDESAIAAISCTNNVYAWTRAGQPIAVPRGHEKYEACCGVRIGFSADGRFLIARRSFQPGYDAFVWSRRTGRLAGGRKFPGAESLREFTALPSAPELLILDQAGLRRLAPSGGAPGATLLRAEAAADLRGIAASSDGSRIVTIEGTDDIVLRAGDGAIVARVTLR